MLTDCLRGDGGNDVVGAACVMFDVVVVVVSDDDDDNDDKQLDAGVSIAISTDLLILPPPRSDTDTNKYHLLLTSRQYILSLYLGIKLAPKLNISSVILDSPLIKEILNQNKWDI